MIKIIVLFLLMLATNNIYCTECSQKDNTCPKPSMAKEIQPAGLKELAEIKLQDITEQPIASTCQPCTNKVQTNLAAESKPLCDQLKQLAQQSSASTPQTDTMTIAQAATQPLNTSVSSIAQATEKQTISVVHKTSTAQKTRNITVTNNITKDMITYKKHWSGNHTPSKFYVKINGEKLPNNFGRSSTKKQATQHTQKELTIANDTLDVEIYFKFTYMGITHHEETIKYTGTLPHDAAAIASSFSWDNDKKIILETDKQQPLTLVEVKK